jgi:RNA polymerase sigma-70 factor (ECF subfamily)
VTELAGIDAVLASARPRAVGALLRYFRDLDRAEEAFQEACLRALRNWPQNGPPRDAVAWLIMVGRNAALDAVRRDSRNRPLPPDEAISDLDDAEAGLAERIDNSHYRDDVLRLLFICCHPDLPATQQIALALRIVSGLTVKEIARAFLVGESAMEQRITRAKRLVAAAAADVPFEAPGAVERSERLAAVAAMVYLLFNEAIRPAAARRISAPVCARRRSGLPASSSGCFRLSRRSWGSPRCACCSMHAPRRGWTRTARSSCWRTRTAACGTAR